MRMESILGGAAHDLYAMMADLATLPETATRATRGCPPTGCCGWRRGRRELGQEVEMPRAFIVPGDSIAGAALEAGRGPVVTGGGERLVARAGPRGRIAR